MGKLKVSVSYCVSYSVYLIRGLLEELVVDFVSYFNQTFDFLCFGISYINCVSIGAIYLPELYVILFCCLIDTTAQDKKGKKRVEDDGVSYTTPKATISSLLLGSSQGTSPSVLETNVVEYDELIARAARKRSPIWKHFKEYKVTKIVKVKGGEDRVIEKWRAKCIYCPKGKLGDYACDSTSNGNSGMHRHINKTCKFYPGRRSVQRNQKVIVGDKSKGNTMKMVAFNEDEVMQACVEMVVVDELPFSFVEKQGFRHFCFVAIPQWTVPCIRTLVTKFLALYDKTKRKLKHNISRHRVCLTTDTWTSVQNVNYMVLTAHFIDDKWEMHKRVINLCPISSHSGNSIGLLIESCLLQWGISKVLTITVDNATTNKCAIEYVRSKLNRREKSEAVLGGKYMHVRCTAHITNLIVGSGLKRLNKAVLAIRNAVKYVRSSAARLDSFKAAVAKEEIPCKGLCVMDIPTRWNSTFLMLESAYKFKAAFARMEVEDAGFAAYFKEPDEEFDEDGNLISTIGRRGKVGPSSHEDWDKAEVFVQFLRVFYEVTLRVSASNKPTIHTTFHDVLSMEKEIEKLFVLDELQTNSASEKVLMEMAKNMQEKFLKYYGSYKDLNPLVFMGLILDPRFKLQHITHLFNCVELGQKEVERKTTELRGVLLSLYDEYAPKDVPAQKKVVQEFESLAESTITSTSSRGYNSYISDWRKVVSQKDQASVIAHEVDRYLLDPLEAINEKEPAKFPILLWWRMNGNKYPVLATIAKDILAVQVSTAASESTFSTGGRVVDSFRSSLTPKSVEALICLQSWLRGNEISYEDEEPCHKEFEFIESCEKEHATTASSSNCPPPKPKGTIEIDGDAVEEGSEGDEGSDGEEVGYDQSNDSSSN
ncbi:zinc finger BED domain-containing protein RICESLEEPER 2-like [Argentina anserina]|uniref:zinc finger BED domain-containing protein RICESLEEPER 2-like n=1 Tax=Argentina anserina TaxID=57926 RepID=UPI00217681EC|nr:zinc finger BED domain-containing protein RICESLEEPER 2-like [Potentilla anserina]